MYPCVIQRVSHLQDCGDSQGRRNANPNSHIRSHHGEKHRKDDGKLICKYPPKPPIDAPCTTLDLMSGTNSIPSPLCKLDCENFDCMVSNALATYSTVLVGGSSHKWKELLRTRHCGDGFPKSKNIPQVWPAGSCVYVANGMVPPRETRSLQLYCRAARAAICMNQPQKTTATNNTTRKVRRPLNLFPAIFNDTALRLNSFMFKHQSTSAHSQIAS